MQKHSIRTLRGVQTEASLIILVIPGQPGATTLYNLGPAPPILFALLWLPSGTAAPQDRASLTLTLLTPNSLLVVNSNNVSEAVDRPLPGNSG